VLKHFGYREFSGFFDFMNTSKVDVIKHILANDFNEILNDTNNVSLVCNQLTIEPETGEHLPTSVRTSNKFYNIDYNNVDEAIFPHHDLNSEKDKNHFIKCKERFKKLVNHNTLFNYTFNTWENNITEDDMETIVKTLKDVHGFENFKICFIGVSINNYSNFKLVVKSEYYDVWEFTINNSFTGGLFSNNIDNENYIRIIKNYDIDDNRLTKEEIDMEPKTHYNPWPIGKVPKELQRLELDRLKELGYDWNDPRDVIDMFEQKVAKFSGSKYAVSIDCCSHGLFLSLKYLQSIGESPKETILTIPKMTYISAPMQIIHAGNQVVFEDLEWSGVYQLKGSRVWDGAVRWNKGMYVGNDALQVVSFQIKKRIPIGKGGIILTDDYEAYKWLKLASYDGRDLNTPYTDVNHVKMLGYHMYMTPEDAARGIILIDSVPEENEDTGNHNTYVDVSEIFKNIF
jgi:hypothetical protein